MKPDWHLVNRIREEKRQLNKGLSKTFMLAKDLLVCTFSLNILSLFYEQELIMLAIFHVSGKTPWLSEDFKTWTRGSVIESPHN